MALIMTCLLISSCGFHLRGYYPLPLQLKSLYIEADDPYDDFVKNFKLILKESHVNLTDRKENNYTFKILSLMKSALLLNYQPPTLKFTQDYTRKYSLTYTVNFEILDKKNRVIIPQHSIAQSRVLTIRESRILAGSNEAMFIYNSMIPDLIASIMDRLSSLEIKQILHSDRPS